MNWQGKKVVITGASAGIGAATALRFAAAGANVLGIARRGDRLQGLEKNAGVSSLILDITDATAVAQAGKEGHFENVDVLVNNAGLARGTAPMQSADEADWQEMMETNVMALLRITRAVLPGMLARKSGHVVHLGSVAGRWVYPGGGVYCATKHAVRALAEGLRLDIQGSGVRVTNIEPGLVQTEFSEVRFRGDKERAKAVYANTRAMVPQDVAEAIFWSCSLPNHVNVQEMVLYPTDQAAIRDVYRTA